MKKYKLLKDLPGINKGIEYKYDSINFSRDYLLEHGYIEEVEEDKVEKFIQKICNDMCININGINGDILKGYIEDNGKEEIYGKINTIFIKNNDIEVEKYLKQLLNCLDNYIITKI